MYVTWLLCLYCVLQLMFESVMETIDPRHTSQQLI